jgi:hypothetical protein
MIDEGNNDNGRRRHMLILKANTFCVVLNGFYAS